MAGYFLQQPLYKQFACKHATFPHHPCYLCYLQGCFKSYPTETWQTYVLIRNFDRILSIFTLSAQTWDILMLPIIASGYGYGWSFYRFRSWISSNKIYCLWAFNMNISQSYITHFFNLWSQEMNIINYIKGRNTSGS